VVRFSDFLGRGDDEEPNGAPPTPNEPLPDAPSEPPPPPPPATTGSDDERVFVESLPPVDDDFLPRRKRR
jgi:hypothetical protein